MTTWSVKGKTCMVTGASSGIGRVTAYELAKAGAAVILVCRDRARGEAAVREIAEASGNDAVELRLADLADQEAIRALAAGFLAERRPLHVLVNNAGVFNMRRRTTRDGVEATFGVNHLAYFLLTLLLLERIKESAPARIVNVASDAHRWARGIAFDDLGSERRYGAMRVYGQSKLANILFTVELARRLEGTGVTVNCLHPGAIATGLGRNNGVLAKVLLPLVQPFLKTPERGARTSVFLASSPDVDGVSGRYFVDCRAATPSRAALDAAAARRLWSVSEEMTNLGATRKA